MRSLVFLGAGLLLLPFASPSTSAATQAAQVRLYGLSVRLEPGTASQFGLESTLTFSSADFNAPNHELFPILESDFSHASLFLLDAPDFPEPLPGQLLTTIPESLDVSSNGIPDFYEVDVGVQTTIATGIWASPVSEGTARITWQRNPGQTRGTATIQLTSSEFGVLPTFTHAFEIFEFAGTLNYLPSADLVRATIELSRVGAPAERLLGPVLIRREATNRFNQISFESGSWTNAAGLVVPVAAADLERDPVLATNYFGALRLDNGDPATPEIDYDLFYISIDDPHDANANRIPDLTDDLVAPPAAPTLSLAREGDELRLTITGTPGATFRLERASLLPPAWILDREITLDAPTLSLPLPNPGPGPRFWRLHRP